MLVSTEGNAIILASKDIGCIMMSMGDELCRVPHSLHFGNQPIVEISGSYGSEWVFCDVAPHNLVDVYRRFRGACCLHQTTRRNIPDDSHLLFCGLFNDTLSSSNCIVSSGKMIKEREKDVEKSGSSLI
jgi:hypothetical protein